MLETIFSWTTLWWLILVLYVPACIGLIVVVLLQKGKGVGFAGAFGAGGGGDTLFGPRSSRSLPQRLTYGAAALFMILSLVLSMLSGKVGRAAAPDIVDETTPAATSTMDALFDNGTPAEENAASDESAEAPAAVTVTPEASDAETAAPAAPAAPEVTVETPVESAPAEATVETPTETPAPAAAPAEEPHTQEAPAEEAPAQQ